MTLEVECLGPRSERPFEDAAKWRLPREVSAKLIEQDTWLARAKKYGVVP